MSGLVGRFRAHVTRRRLFPEPGPVIVAVSGGPDSVALLDLLHQTAAGWGLGLVVAHADHGIRPDSAAVARDVQALATRFGLPFELGELALGPRAGETVARRARYAWLREVQRRRGARYLVTAHHTDDQIETVLLRVLRGSAPAGLAGMRARGPQGLVRPLLPFSRVDLAEYVRARGLASHEDPANRDTRHLRSWVRTSLLPAITARLGPRALEDLTRLAHAAARDRRAWDHALELVPELGVSPEAAGFSVARGVLAGYDHSLAIALLRAAARRVGLVLGPTRARRLLALAEGASGRRVQLGAGWTGEAAFERLVIRRDEPTSHLDRLVGSGDHGQARFGDYALEWRSEQAPQAIDRSAWTTWLAGPGWEVRPLAAGDVLRPLGGVGRRPVRRLLMEARVPRSARASYPVLARGDLILWVPGVCRSADELPAPGTRAVRIDVRGADA